MKYTSLECVTISHSPTPHVPQPILLLQQAQSDPPSIATEYGHAGVSKLVQDPGGGKWSSMQRIYTMQATVDVRKQLLVYGVGTVSIRTVYEDGISPGCIGTCSRAKKELLLWWQ